MVKTAIEQRDDHPPPRVDVLAEAKGNYPAGRMVISSPREIEAIVRRIPIGRVTTLSALRSNLAKSHRADFACPLTTGIFARIVAEAAEEERALGRTAIAPYWRLVRDDGAMIDKFPGGVVAQARVLATEGVTVLHVGKVPRVTEVEHFAWTPPPLGKSGERAVTPKGRPKTRKR
jgi:alkylated DNA nucleotide flippase Atl1